MSRVQTYIRAREMLVGFRDECHPGCWVNASLSGFNSARAYETIAIQLHDEALGISVHVDVVDDHVEAALARMAEEYGTKRTAKIEALGKALAVAKERESANAKIVASGAEEGVEG